MKRALFATKATMSIRISITLISAMLLLSASLWGCEETHKSASTGTTASQVKGQAEAEKSTFGASKKTSKAATKENVSGVPKKGAAPSMKMAPRRPSPTSAVTATSLGAAPQEITPAGGSKEVVVKGLGFNVPMEWQVLPSTSRMRLIEMIAPGPGGNADFTAFQFGNAAMVDSNIQRWKGHFQNPAGGEVAVQSEVIDVGGLKVTLVSMGGTYTAAKNLMNPAAGKFNEANWGIAVAIVDMPSSPFFLRIRGPQKTLDLWKEGFMSLIKSIKISA